MKEHKGQIEILLEENEEKILILAQNQASRLCLEGTFAYIPNELIRKISILIFQSEYSMKMFSVVYPVTETIKAILNYEEIKDIFTSFNL